MTSTSTNSLTGPAGAHIPPSDSALRAALRRFCKNKAAVAGFLIFAVICLACILAPYMTQWTYYSFNVDERLAMPSFRHLLGTDHFGRDTFTRLLYGGRITLRITFVSTIVAAIIGSIVGLIAGYFGGRSDFIVSLVLDILASIPIILLVIVVESLLGFGHGYFMYAMIIAAIPQFARLVRASVMNIMGRTYIEAARALGVNHRKIIFRHILHNIASPLIVRFTSGAAEALLTCTIMGYLGIGIRPPLPEWGVIVNNARGVIRTHPHLMVIPCAVIAICVISLNLFGDGLRDALDPKE